MAWRQALLRTAAGGFGLRSAAAHAAAAHCSVRRVVTTVCPGPVTCPRPVQLCLCPFRCLARQPCTSQAADAVGRAGCPRAPVARQRRPTCSACSSLELGHGCMHVLLCPSPFLSRPFSACFSECASASPLLLPRPVAHSAMGLQTAWAIMRELALAPATLASATTGSVLSSPSVPPPLSPEVEKPGLLPPRPVELGSCEAGATPANGRRPADVFLPSWGLHGPAVFHLAVTSGLRCGAAASSAADGARACADYEERKRSDLNTATMCQQQGLQFVSLIAESVGGEWGRESIKTFRHLGSLLAGRTSDRPASVTEHLLQSFIV